MEYLVEYV
uniref:Uncharacterized protein n=1 Tax=Rhizophora mucronata TaxID=61149 RepID=A0A2P2PJX7_RHIMU